MNAPQKTPALSTQILLDARGNVMSPEAQRSEPDLVLVPEEVATLDALAAALARAPGAQLIAIELPVFSDGRAHSAALLLRRDLGYAGELRAVGDVGVDHLHYLARVGFDSFLLRPGVELDDAQAALHRFRHHYVGVRTVKGLGRGQEAA